MATKNLDALADAIDAMGASALTHQLVQRRAKLAIRGRRRELLEAAAERMRDMSDPFHTSFLVEHHVRLDECGDMSEDIAQAVEIMLTLSPEEFAALLARGYSAPLPPAPEGA